MRKSRVYSVLQDTSIQKQAKEAGLKNPFKGPSRYEKEDAQTFYGREKEQGDLLRVISQNTLTLLYSKSGVGKSSIINAGIIPKLRKLQTYFPVYIRVSDKMIDENVNNYALAIINTIKREAQKNGIEIQTDYINS